MPTFDLVLIILFLYFVFSGFWFGLIHTVGVILGVVVGVLAAGNFYESVATFLQFLFFKAGVAHVVAFILIFVVVNQLVGFIFQRIDKGFKLVSIIPFLGPINRLAGAVLGIVAGFLILGTILTVAKAYPFSDSFSHSLETSQIAHLLIGGAAILTALLPEHLKSIIRAA